MRKTEIAPLGLIFGILISNSAWADKACFEIQGMTCATCGITVKAAVKKIKGVQEVIASVEKKSAVVQYNSDRTNSDAIKNAIDGVGYKAEIKECKKIES